MSTLGRIAARGAATTMGGQIIRIVLQYGSLVVLARLLTPQQFGVVAMATVIVGLADVFRDFGLSTAAVQAKTLSAAQQTNLFWANTVIGVVLTALLWATAPLIAELYREPIVTEVLRGLAWLFIINGLATQYRARLNRNLNFGVLAGIDIAAQGVSVAVAITLAATGFGWWALVWSQLALAITGLAAMVVVTRWLPGWPVKGAKMRPLWSFGWDMLATQMVGYIGANVDKFLVGRQLGSTPAGLYDRAARVVNQPLTQLRAPTSSVALPILSKLQDQPARYMEFVIRGQVGLGYTLVAAVALIAAAADPVVAITLGEQFADSVPVVQAVAYAGAANTIAYVAYWVFVSKGYTRELSQWSLITAVLRIIAVIIGLQWGLLGVAWAAALVPFCTAPISMLWLARLTEQSFVKVLTGFFRIVGVFIAASAVGAYAENVVDGGLLVSLVVACAGCVATYIAALVLPAYRRDAAHLMEFVKLFAHRGKKTS